MIVNLENYTTPQLCDYWKQERFVCTAQLDEAGDTMSVWTNLHGSEQEPMVVYTADSSSGVTIDVTEYMRAYGSTATNLYFRNDARNLTCELRPTIKGLINPAGVIIPFHFGNSYCPIIPPYKMIAPASGALVAELYSTGAGASVTGNASIQTGNRRIAITGDFSFKAVPYGDARKYTIVKQVCGVEYALVRWVSFSGVQRVHIFEVVKPTTASADNYTLMPVDNEYNEVKGRVDGFTLRMTDLCPYDLWYYADVITSSKVEVSLDNGTTYNRVQVTTKNITLPDGDTKTSGKLEIAVNWKRYDAVAM